MGRRTRYNETVLDHFENPRNVGVIEDADADVTVSNPVCGDTIRLTLRIRGGVIEAARFKALGCGAAIASASRLTEMLAGRGLPEVAAMEDEAVAAALGGLPRSKLGCSVLAEEAAAAAVESYRKTDSSGPRGQ
jgi:nitrogen fixation NifU-like protein